MSSKLRVLIVEDEVLVAMDAETTLDNSGHIVTVVGTGHGAMAQINTGSFDVAVVDLGLPARRRYSDCLDAAGSPSHGDRCQHRLQQPGRGSSIATASSRRPCGREALGQARFAQCSYTCGADVHHALARQVSSFGIPARRNAQRNFSRLKERRPRLHSATTQMAGHWLVQRNQSVGGKLDQLSKPFWRARRPPTHRVLPVDDFGTLMWAASAYRQRFGEAAPIYPFVEQPELAVALRKAVQRGVPHTAETLAMRLDAPTPRPDAETEQ